VDADGWIVDQPLDGGGGGRRGGRKRGGHGGTKCSAAPRSKGVKKQASPFCQEY
jgi:hypothetical protein